MPAVLAGVITVSDLALNTFTDDPGVLPNSTVNVSIKYFPKIVTVVPPAAEPRDGATRFIIGATTNVKPNSLVADPPGAINTTSTVRADLTGVITVTDLSLTLIIDVPAVPPNITADVSVKFIPVIVTVVPPVIGPLDDVTAVIVGGAYVVNDMIEPVVVPLELDATIRKK